MALFQEKTPHSPSPASMRKRPPSSSIKCDSFSSVAIPPLAAGAQLLARRHVQSSEEEETSQQEMRNETYHSCSSCEGSQISIDTFTDAPRRSRRNRFRESGEECTISPLTCRRSYSCDSPTKYKFHTEILNKEYFLTNATIPLQQGWKRSSSLPTIQPLIQRRKELTPSDPSSIDKSASRTSDVVTTSSPSLSLSSQRWAPADRSFLTPAQGRRKQLNRTPRMDQLKHDSDGISSQGDPGQQLLPLTPPPPPPPPCYDDSDDEFEISQLTDHNNLKKEKEPDSMRWCPKLNHEVGSTLRSYSLSPSILPKKRGERRELRRSTTVGDVAKSISPTLSAIKKPLPSPILKRPQKKLSLSEYKKHGVVQYMRPDGDEFNIPKYIGKQRKESCTSTEETARINTVQRLHEELKFICESNLPDRAERAGRVFRDLERGSVQPYSETLQLLEACSLFSETSSKKNNLQSLGINKERHNQEVDTPTAGNRKKVRFSATNTLRIIQRRRSISSTERMGDPLTPPKRVSKSMSLVAGRFASGMQPDDSPSIPRRSNSMSSLISNASFETLESNAEIRSSDVSNDNSLDCLRLLFVDETRRVGSPQLSYAKARHCYPIVGASTLAQTSSHTTTKQLRQRYKRRISIGYDMERRCDFPLTPPRRVSAPLELLLSQVSMQSDEKGLKHSPRKDAIKPEKEDLAPSQSKNKTFKKPPTSAQIINVINSGDKSVVSHVSHHESIMPEKWTKIWLPLRSSSLSMLSSSASALSATKAAAQRRESKKDDLQQISTSRTRLPHSQTSPRTLSTGDTPILATKAQRMKLNLLTSYVGRDTMPFEEGPRANRRNRSAPHSGSRSRRRTKVQETDTDHKSKSTHGRLSIGTK